MRIHYEDFCSEMDTNYIQYSKHKTSNLENDFSLWENH